MKITPERRFVSVLFADIKGFTSLSETLDPEEVEEIIEEIFTQFREIIEKNGGYLDKFIGDAVMAVFGAPYSYGDDHRRAVYTALEMQKIMEKFNRENDLSRDLEIRIGLNSGEVLWSSIAGEKPTVMGDTVNVAQRLESICEPGKVFVSEKTKELTEEYFEFKFIGETRVKGRKEPVKIFEVLSERINRKFKGHVRLPFIEREKEIETILTKLNNREVRIINIIGETGIGKTRFLLELYNTLKDNSKYQLVFLHGDPLKRETLGSFKEFLDGLLKEFPGNSTQDKLTNLLEGTSFEVFIPFIKTIFEEGPGMIPRYELRLKELVENLFELPQFSKIHVIVFIDDFHHLDNSSVTIFKRLFKDNLENLVFLITSPQPTILSGASNFVLKLAPLSKNAIHIFIKEIFKTEEIDESLVEEIYQKSGGNPYYAEELLYYVYVQGAYQTKPLKLSRGLSLPGSLKNVLTARIDILPFKERETTKKAAVIGKTFWDVLLYDLMGEKEEGVLTALINSRIILKNPTSLLKNAQEYRFYSELLQEAAYSILTKRERKKLHKKIAEFLSKYSDSPFLIYYAGKHYKLANSTEKAKSFLLKAVRYATSKGDIRLALRALEEIEEKNAELYIKKGEFHRILFEPANAIESFKKAMELSTLGSYLWTVAKIKLIKSYEELGDYEKVETLLKDFNAHIPELKLLILIRRGWLYYRKGVVKEVLTVAQEMKKLIPSIKGRSEKEIEALAGAYNFLAIVEGWFNNNYQEAIDYIDKALELLKSNPNRDWEARLRYNRVVLMKGLGMREEAIKELFKVEQYLRRIGNLHFLCSVYITLGSLYSKPSTADKAIEYFEKAINIAEVIDNKYFKVQSLLNLASIYIMSQRLKEAEDVIEQVLDLSFQHNFQELLRFAKYYKTKLLIIKYGTKDEKVQKEIESLYKEWAKLPKELLSDIARWKVEASLSKKDYKKIRETINKIEDIYPINVRLYKSLLKLIMNGKNAKNEAEHILKSISFSQLKLYEEYLLYFFLRLILLKREPDDEEKRKFQESFPEGVYIVPEHLREFLFEPSKRPLLLQSLPDHYRELYLRFL